MRLTDFDPGKEGVIVEISDDQVSSRLAECGILPGAQFLMLVKASFKGPVVIRVGENRIAMRYAEAQLIQVS